MTALLVDRWRTAVRAPVRAADRAARLADVQPRLGPAYTREGRVVACWARIFEARLIHAERVVKGSWLP